MFYQGVFKQKRKAAISLGILLCALLWALTVADQPMTSEERQRKRETARKEMLEAEQMLARTTDSARADQLQQPWRLTSLTIAKVILRLNSEGFVF